MVVRARYDSITCVPLRWHTNGTHDGASPIGALTFSPMFWGLTINEWLTLAAIVVAPLVALQVSQRLERQRAKRDRRLIIFRALMANRSSALAPDHVQALNMIDIEFAGK